MTSIKISIIICTFNREEILQDCISSILSQTIDKNNYEVVVVDNNSSDNTASIIKTKFPEVHYCFEANKGLSYARNTGYKNASHEWINYIDDDALAHKDYVEQIIWTIANYNWDCFGGIFLRWFKYGKPLWYPKNFGTNKYDHNEIGILPEKKYATGGVFTIRKSVLKQLNGFNVNYGMSANNIGYGEETELQVRLRSKGYVIGFNPNIKIDHLVASYKLSVLWHLRAAWKNEKAVVLINGDKHKYPFWQTVSRIIRAGIKRLKYLSKLKEKNYYWQNFLFDYSEPILRLMSAMKTIYFTRKKNA